MPRAAPSLYALNPAMPVLLRPDGAVQVGWDPRRAVLIRPPNDLAAAELAALLRSMRSPIPITELQRQAADRGPLLCFGFGCLPMLGRCELSD
jgi:hypothetical protein